MDAAAVESLHGAFSSTRIIEFNKAVVVPLAVELLSRHQCLLGLGRKRSSLDQKTQKCFRWVRSPDGRKHKKRKELLRGLRLPMSGFRANSHSCPG